jgi:hypothetical protein
MMHLRSLLALSCVLLWSCGDQPASTTLAEAGKQSVILGLELGELDDTYIDAYFGPAEWQSRTQKQRRSTAELASATANLLRTLEAFQPSSKEQALRHRLLVGKVRAMDARARMLLGEKFSFAEEARLLFDFQSYNADFAEFDLLLTKLDEIVPGSGSLYDRVSLLRAGVVIPKDKLDSVLRRAIEECRERTIRYFDLPEDEQFELEYVSGVTWSGFLEYVGNNKSLMSINTDVPMTLSKAVDLACHEGYPGHHLYSLLADQRFLKELNWTEFQLLPAYTPAMPIIEGTAEYGLSLVFSDNENVAFQRNVLAPIAGIDPKTLEIWNDYQRLHDQFEDHAWGAIAQQYLDGEISRDEAIRGCIKYGLYSPKEAERKVRFIEEVGSYVLNYSLGEDAVSVYIESHGDVYADKWAAFKKLIDELPTARHLAQLH